MSLQNGPSGFKPLIIVVAFIFAVIGVSAAAVHFLGVGEAMGSFCFAVIILLALQPLLLTLYGSIKPGTWLAAHLGFLDHLTFIRFVTPHNSLGSQSVLGPIGQKRIEAQQWKQLHEDCQRLSSDLALVRKSIMLDDMDTTIHDLEMLWEMRCSDKARTFADVDRLPNGPVKQEFLRTISETAWIDRVKTVICTVDEIQIRICKPNNIFGGGQSRESLDELINALGVLETIINQMLQFFDDRLKRVLQDLDTEIESARENTTGPIGALSG